MDRRKKKYIKDQLYGYKTDLSTVFSKLTIERTVTKQGSFANAEMFRKSISWRINLTNKFVDKESITDYREISGNILPIGIYFLIKDTSVWQMVYVLSLCPKT